MKATQARRRHGTKDANNWMLRATSVQCREIAQENTSSALALIYSSIHCCCAAQEYKIFCCCRLVYSQSIVHLHSDGRRNQPWRKRKSSFVFVINYSVKRRVQTTLYEDSQAMQHGARIPRLLPGCIYMFYTRAKQRVQQTLLQKMVMQCRSVSTAIVIVIVMTIFAIMPNT